MAISAKFLIICAFIACNLTLTAGKVKTRKCDSGGGDGSDFDFYVHGCNGDRCDISDGNAYSVAASWKFGGKRNTETLGLYFSAFIQGQEYPQIISSHWSPEGGLLRPGKTHWINDTFTAPHFLLPKSENGFVRLSLQEGTRKELCREADIRINGAYFPLVSASLLIIQALIVLKNLL